MGFHERWFAALLKTGTPSSAAVRCCLSPPPPFPSTVTIQQRGKTPPLRATGKY